MGSKKERPEQGVRGDADGRHIEEGSTAGLGLTDHGVSQLTREKNSTCDMRRLLTALLIATIALASCGGGGDDAGKATDSGPVSDYSGYGFRGGRTIAFSVFDGGLVYAFYQSDFSVPPIPVYAYAGFFVGVTTDAGSMRTYHGTDFDFDAVSAYPSELTLNLDAPNGSAQGPLVHIGSGDTVGDLVYGTYSSISTAPTTATLAGHYAAYARSVTNSVPAMTATVDSSGSISVSGGGCNVTGQLSARPLANVYDASISLHGICPASPGAYKGHAYQSFITGNIFLMVTDSSGGHGLLLHFFSAT